MNAKQQQHLEDWYAFLYEQQEDASPIVTHIARRLSGEKLSILEPACGGGKICGPLAEAGHEVTGFDCNASMLRYARKRASALLNLHIDQADMLCRDWGEDYDVVLLASNLMNNIDTDWEYKQAQKKLLTQAQRALKPDGLLFLDFDCPSSLRPFAEPGEWVCFEGRDDQETFGRYVVVNGTSNDHSRMVYYSRRYELRPKDAAPFSCTVRKEKHFATLEWMGAQLYRAGFTVEALYGGYGGEPFDQGHRRCVLWCRRC